MGNFKNIKSKQNNPSNAKQIGFIISSHLHDWLFLNLVIMINNFNFQYQNVTKKIDLEWNSKSIFCQFGFICFSKSKNISSNKSSAGKSDQNNSLKVQFSPPDSTRLDNMWHRSKHDSAVFLFSHPPGLAKKTAITQSAKIRKNVQFKEATLFSSKAKINGFLKYIFRMEWLQRGMRSEEKFSKM